MSLWVAGLASLTLAAPPDGVAHGPNADVQSIRELSNHILDSQPRHSAARDAVQQLRARLTELEKALTDLERDPAPALIDRLGARKAAAVAAYRRIQVKADSKPGAKGSKAKGVSKSSPTQRVGDRRARVDTAAEFAELWRDVDYALADPIGQRARLRLARERIEAALEQPVDLGGPTMTWRLDFATSDRQ